MNGTLQDASRESRLHSSPIWHERTARQAREAAQRCDDAGNPGYADTLLRLAAQHEKQAAKLRAAPCLH